ncbi:MAG: hypothetical protein HJJLKODD_01281 [Phycisphaerae bacterium]|nr:hypothetical protein [Phycisphaerae bacterium]
MLFIQLHMVALLLLSPAQASQPQSQAASAPSSQQVVEAVSNLLYWSLILLVILLFGVLAIWIAWRRSNEGWSSSRSEGLDYVDVWTQHQDPRKMQLEKEMAETRGDIEYQQDQDDTDLPLDDEEETGEEWKNSDPS